MGDYYRQKLSAERLKRCYELAPPRIQQYLEAELDYVLERIHSCDSVLELGCGFGRILPPLAQKAGLVIGIDTSFPSLLLGQERVRSIPNCHLLKMNALRLAFRDRVFDRVICVQNGISAFHVPQQDLILESIRVTKPGCTILFSTYSKRFWDHRLQWFQLQSDAGLVGTINFQKTRDGVIVCEDGFTATTVSPAQFLSLTAELDVDTQITEVDESSLFCEIVPR
jgi:SAM-dependent methyltransferase